MDDSKILLEKLIYVIQTLNEQWDQNKPLIKTITLIIGIITGIFIPKLFFLIIILLVGGQRVFYHIYMQYLKDKEAIEKVDETHYN